MADARSCGFLEQELAAARSPDGPFGLWMSGLWPYTVPVSFSDRKTLFTMLLRRLIEDGDVVLLIPNGVECVVRSQGGFDAIWAVTPGKMIRFIEAHWPTDIQDENDPKFNAFWYDPDRCPGLGWIDPVTHEIVSS